MSVNDCCFIVGVRQTDLEAMALSRGVGWVLTQNRHENDECVWLIKYYGLNLYIILILKQKYEDKF